MPVSGTFLAAVHRLGFTTMHAFLLDAYVRRELGVLHIARMCGVRDSTVRRELAKHDIPRRSRGGPNNTSIPLTPVIQSEIATHGVPTVARQHGWTSAQVYRALRRKSC